MYHGITRRRWPKNNRSRLSQHYIYIRTFQARKAPLRCLKFFSEFFKEHPRHIPKTALFEPFWYSDNFRRSRFYLLLKKKEIVCLITGFKIFSIFSLVSADFDSKSKAELKSKRPSSQRVFFCPFTGPG